MNFRAISIIALSFLAACSTSNQGNRINPKMVSGSGNTCLSDRELSSLPPIAIAGNISAIRSLTLHYSVCTDNRTETINWMRAGSDFGDIESQKDLIDELQRLNIPSEVTEARLLAQKWALENLIK